MSIRAYRALTRVVAPLLVLGFTLGSAESAHAQRPAVTTRVLVFTGAGFGGEVDIQYDGAVSVPVGTASLAATPLAGVRVETVFLRYLAFGGQLEASFWRGKDDSRRNPMLDLSITPRVRYPILLGTRFLVEPYVVIPIGFSLAMWNSSVDLVGELDRVNPGLVIGALGGVTLLTRSHVGAMLEFGWMHHVAYDEVDGGRFTLTMNQATLRAGVVYAF
jgi:hypothetical protein